MKCVIIRVLSVNSALKPQFLDLKVLLSCPQYQGIRGLLFDLYTSCTNASITSDNIFREGPHNTCNNQRQVFAEFTIG